jgi:ribosomal protein S7
MKTKIFNKQIENIDQKNQNIVLKKKKKLPSLAIFINILLKKGLKLKNFLLFFKLLILLKLKILEIQKIREIIRKKPIFFFFKILEKVSIPTKIHALNSAGKIYYIPIPITPLKQLFITIKELIKNAKLRLESTFILKLLGEVIDSFYKKSATFKYKLEQINFAFENKQFFRFLIKYQPKKKRKKKKKVKLPTRYFYS